MHPCFSDASDFRPVGAAETSVEHGPDVTLGFVVRCPFGPGTDAILLLHGNRKTGTHGVAIGTVVGFHIEPPPKPPMNMNLLSNPRRWTDDYGGD
jgi:hypothetical protein